MASDFAAPPLLPSEQHMETPQESFDAPTMNGYVASYLSFTSPPSSPSHRYAPCTTAHADLFSSDRHIDEAALSAQPIDSAVDAPSEIPVGPSDAVIDAKLSAAPSADPNPSGPSPVEDVAAGIQPVANFIPKDSSHLSHPTPPPDEPLITGAADADADVDMTSSEVPPPQPLEESPIAPPESSLVRPREDDGDDEPAAKRSKMDDGTPPVVAEPVAEVLAEETTSAPIIEPSEAITASVMETVDEPAAATPAVATPEVPMTDVALEPTEPAVEPTVPSLPESLSTDVKVEATPVETQSSLVPAESMDSTAAVVAETPVETQPAAPAPTEDTQTPVTTAPESTAKVAYDTAPMTKLQKNSLLDKMKNLKKVKSAVPFLKPVDYVALNIPNYPDIIQNPMDISTMEAKLKNDQYGSLQDYVNDFDLIISNVKRFNGEHHVITQSGLNMDAYFRRMMETVPRADEAPPPKQEKKRSPSATREKPPRRESRVPAAPAAPAPAPAPAQSAASTYALQADGTPQIRRQSSNRPARAIKPPQNREIPYAKPKRKAHMLELRFCEHVLDEIRSAKYGQYNHPFQTPVDPVALNIPQYRSIIKQPMDLGTMATKLKHGEYGTAREFKADFDLVIKNCMLFNPAGNPVRDMAVQLSRDFEELWRKKNEWERKNQPASNRASSASGDEESADEEEEEEDDEDDKTATIRALQKQLADMQNALSGMTDVKVPKKKSKPAKSAAPKKVGSMSAAPKSKASSKPAAKPKKARIVTYDEKQEISESVSKMSDKQIEGLTTIITTNCVQYRDQEEMELEIDELPNHVQLMLLDYVRKLFGKKKSAAVMRDESPEDAAALDDDDFEPDRRGSGAGGNKRKKHKPMKKEDQQNAIKALEGRLAAFGAQGGTSASGSQSPAVAAAGQAVESSGDEESEESEEE
jgi:bromodomain-containing factor 1